MKRITREWVQKAEDDLRGARKLAPSPRDGSVFFGYNRYMNTRAKQLFDNALQLPDCERAELAARLIESLDSKE